MTAPAGSVAAARPGASPGGLPLRMKVLFVTTLHRTGSWLAEAFAADGAAQIALEEVIGVTAGLARLRDEGFDAVLISHDPGVLDALELVDALRAGGSDEPLIVLGSLPPQELDALCYEAGADDYCCVAETTVRGLLWKFARAIQRFNLSRENRRLIQAERQRLQQEHHEAERLLDQQRALISDLEVLRDGDPATRSGRHGDSPEATSASRLNGVAPGESDECEPPPTTTQYGGAPLHLPAELVDHYRELLRAYVIMGAGNLARDMGALAELLAWSNVSAQRTMQLHVQVLEELIDGLGNRSARHVMSRADLLVLEVMGHLADGYRQRYHERRHPAWQKLLPGFDATGDGEPVIYRSAA